MSNTAPEGWQIKKLGSLVDPRSSNVDKKTDPDEIPVRLCNYTDVYYKNRITSSIDFMQASAKQREIDRFSLEKGDVIITKDSETPGDIAVPAYVSEDLRDVVCGYHLTLLKPHKAESDGEFLSHLFQLPSVQHYFYVLANGITRFGLTADAISDAPLLTPPLPEQQKIAAILSSVDDVIEKTRVQIDKLKNLKTGMMQELLTKGIEHTEFKDSPVGRIPAPWNVITLEQICAPNAPITYGVLKPGPFVAGGKPLLQIRDLDEGSVLPENLHRIGSDLDYEYRRSRVKPGDIVISLVGTVGRTAIIPEWMADANIHRNLGRIRTEQNKLVYHFLQSPMALEQLGLRSSGSSQSALNLTALRQMLLPLPPKDEAKRITGCLDAIDQRLSMVLRRHSKLLTNKKALMQDLLTGNVRVKVDQKESAVA